MNTSPHTFHIPVMGTGFTIDTPLKVARFGIDSVVSITDHRLTEIIREQYSKQYNLPFTPIHEKEDDSRARRITAYLDFMQDVIDMQMDRLMNEDFIEGSDLTKYFELLPNGSPLKKTYDQILDKDGNHQNLKQILKQQIKPGRIDVNVMTKVDKVNLGKGKEVLGQEYNDAHAAVRGFAKSRLHTSLVLSAGLNPRLYGYISEFDDFLPNEDGDFMKHITLKVSDFRSAMIQGKFLAKKGLWVSEFRVESGLNCGGHAFATDGQLLGPILSEFKQNKNALHSELWDIYSTNLKTRELAMPTEVPSIKYSAQGGVGNAEEHNLLLKEFAIDSVGWGSPFLLVPEAVNIDQETLALLENSEEEDYFLSDISPLGVRFNTVKGNSAEIERDDRINRGKPGSPCYKEHLVSNVEFTEAPICTASRQYQRKKIAALELEISDKALLQTEVKKVTDKTCLCVGLGNGAMLQSGNGTYKGLKGVAVCPGPNLAYFSKVVTLAEMVNHIYGRTSGLEKVNRPHMFVKELNIYIDYLVERIAELSDEASVKQRNFVDTFRSNLESCITFYQNLIVTLPTVFEQYSQLIQEELNTASVRLASLKPDG
jgi:hypothetical protein